MEIATAIVIGQAPEEIATGSNVNDRTTGVAIDSKNKKRDQTNGKKEEKENKIERFLTKIMKDKMHG